MKENDTVSTERYILFQKELLFTQNDMQKNVKDRQRFVQIQNVKKNYYKWRTA